LLRDGEIRDCSHVGTKHTKQTTRACRRFIAMKKLADAPVLSSQERHRDEEAAVAKATRGSSETKRQRVS
jgi:hypothetical protein